MDHRGSEVAREKSASFAKRLQWIFFLVAGALALGVRIVRALTEPDFLFNADALFYHALYSDAFLDPHALSGWQTPPSPQYFPELLLYFLLAGAANVFTAQPLWPAMLSWGPLVFLAFFFVCARIAALLNIPRPKLTAFASATLFFAVGGVAATDHPWHILLTPQHRGGTALVALICAGCMLRMMHERIRALPAVAFVSLQAATLASDGVWAIWFALPAAAGLALVALRCPESRHTVLRLLALHVAAILLGLWWAQCFAGVFPWLRPEATMFARLPDGAIMLERVAAIFTYRWYMPLFPLLAVFAAAALARTTDAGLNFGLAFVLTALAASYASVIVADPDLPFTPRYLAAPFAYLAVAAVFALAHAPRRDQIFAALAVVLTVASITLLMGRSSGPEPAVCVRKLAAERSLQAGLADYWNAKYLRYVAGVPVNQVGANLEPYYWISNFYWYFDDVAYDFVVIDRLDVARIKARFGAPAEVVRCGASEVWIYGRAEDEALRRLHDFSAAEIELWRRGTGR